MIFTLGFLAASLTGLIFLPAVWRRALRLTLRRLERQMPLSMTEVVAERDRLRAEFAVAQRRLEQKSERIARTRAADLGELGRRAARIAALEVEVAALRDQAADAVQDARQAIAALAAMDAEVGAMVKEFYDQAGQIDRLRSDFEDLQERHRQLGDVAEQRRATIAALQTSLEAAQARTEDHDREFLERHQSLLQRIEQMQAAAQSREAALADLSAQDLRRTALEARIDAQNQRIAELEAARLAAEQARDAAGAETEALRAALVARDAVIAAHAGRAMEVEEAHGRSAQAWRDAERQMLQRIETLRSEKAVLEGALDVARRDRDALLQERKLAPAPEAAPQPQAPAVSQREREENALLRDSILQVAAEVRRLAEIANAGGPPSKPADAKPRGERAPARGLATAARGLTDHKA